MSRPAPPCMPAASALSLAGLLAQMPGLLPEHVLEQALPGGRGGPLGGLDAGGQLAADGVLELALLLGVPDARLLELGAQALERVHAAPGPHLVLRPVAAGIVGGGVAADAVRD